MGHAPVQPEVYGYDALRASGTLWKATQSLLGTALGIAGTDAELAAWAFLINGRPLWVRCVEGITDRVQKLSMKVEAPHVESLEDYPWSRREIDLFLDGVEAGGTELLVRGEETYGAGKVFAEGIDGRWWAWQEHPEVPGWWRDAGLKSELEIPADPAGESGGEAEGAVPNEAVDPEPREGGGVPSETSGPVPAALEDLLKVQVCSWFGLPPCPRCGKDHGDSEATSEQDAEYRRLSKAGGGPPGETPVPSAAPAKTEKPFCISETCGDYSTDEDWE